MIIIEFLIVLIGLAMTAILFYRFPALPDIKGVAADFPAVSVIIPARNEEKNLPLLLGDLSVQTWPPFEIICVDDASEDATAEIARAYGAKLIALHHKPGGWIGKSWACQNGANAARGELLLFLDADVRLGKDGIGKLMQAYLKSGCTVSVQPYHQTGKLYEQGSLFFNLIQIAANGTALPKPLNAGLYGPVIMIAPSDYRKIGGHESVRNSIIEDMALGSRLKKAGIPYRLFIGDNDVAFRMYGGGLRGLLQGWTKNIATGAVKTPLPVFFMVFLWMTSLASVPLQLIKSAASSNWPWLAVYSLAYLGWAAILYRLVKRIGHFHRWPYILYPLPLLVFLGVFAVSLFIRIFGLPVTWKGRVIAPDEKPCR
ncbi:MAG: glycosyltransferase [Clostridiaceae bacterium]|nr:glycosyltransferase [Clostridiaceae bacterium]